MKKKRALSPFGLSFLDVMCCGFGAVVLLVMILNGQILERREAKGADLREALERASALEAFARDDLEAQRREVQRVQLAEGELQRKIEDLQQAITRETAQGANAAARAAEIEKSLAELARQNRDLADQAKKAAAEKDAAPEVGDRKVGFTGDGQRQYLTGLKLGGARTLILIDKSASMLDEKIVNIVRRKLMPPGARRQAPKWTRAVRSFHWVVANLQPGRQFQVYGFNTTAAPIVNGTAGKWLDAGDATHLSDAIDGVRTLAPEKGTSLINAFAVAAKLSPKPDSIILITDGLPTQGTAAANKGVVTVEERQALFEAALARLSPGIPVNTLLLPIEGDPTAAEAFWRLAIASRGSFITPSRDWP